MMEEYPFESCAKYVNTPSDFGRDNFIVTDGPIDELLNLNIRRHGGFGGAINGCRITIAGSARGNLNLAIAQTDTCVEIGHASRCQLDMRLWRSPNVSIGAFTTIEGCKIVCDLSDVVIGEDCMFSDQVIIQSNDQHGLIDLVSGKLLNDARRRTEIGDHVWLARRTLLMPNVRIGCGSVLAAGSILTKSVQEFKYYAGVPAREIRSRASWTRDPIYASEREKSFFSKFQLK